MDFLNLLFAHFVEVIIFLILFGGSIGGALRWMIRQSFEHRERMQEKRNEELRLRIQLEQSRAALSSARRASGPAPKDASWQDNPVETPYETGYQQIIQQ